MEFLIFAPIFILLVSNSVAGAIIEFILYIILCFIVKKKGRIAINNVVSRREAFFIVGASICLFVMFYKRWINTNLAFEIASVFKIPRDNFILIVAGILICCSVVGVLQLRKPFAFILKYYDRVVSFFARYSFKKLYRIIVIMSTLLYGVFLGGNRRLWIDEAFTCDLIRHSYGEIWKFTAMDVHPPLYYYITKLLTEPFGYSLIAVMAVSIIPYIFIIAFGGYQLNKWCGKKVAVYFMLLFFFFPFTMSYSIEMRMYSWAAAFVFGNAIYAYRCYVEERKTNWLYFVIFGVCSAYTHYFALVSTGFVYLFLLIAVLRKNKRKFSLWAIATLLTIILYLPWIPEFVRQLIFKVNNQYWIPDITIRTIYGYYKSVFGGDVGLLATIFIFLAYLRIFLQIIHQKKQSDILLKNPQKHPLYIFKKHV